MNQQIIRQVALSLITGIGNVLTKQLISYCGSAEEVFKTNRKNLLRVPGIGNRTASSILKKETFSEAEKIVNTCKEKGISILFFTDSAYPSRLKQALDSPSVIYYKGNADLNPQKAVTIVGTRSISRYGKEVSEQIIEDLKPFNPLIISGLAYGVDIYAHKLSLEHDLTTVAVLGGGIGKIYPSLHKNIANRIIDHGGLVSEYPYQTVPETHYFPARNRIIAGMSDVVIIIEAAKKGGALITAEYANSYNREVFAVPGGLNYPYSKGCNNLIKTHKAHILTGVKDIEYIMNWDLVKKEADQISHPIIDELTDDEALVIQTLMDNQKELIIDNLSWKSQIPLNKLASLLLSLEFKGLVRSLPGKKFKLSV